MGSVKTPKWQRTTLTLIYYDTDIQSYILLPLLPLANVFWRFVQVQWKVAGYVSEQVCFAAGMSPEFICAFSPIKHS